LISGWVEIHPDDIQIVRDFFPQAIPIDRRGIPLPPRRISDETQMCNGCVASGFRNLKTRGTRGRNSTLIHDLKISRM
jgi:hypothetical protein